MSDKNVIDEAPLNTAVHFKQKIPLMRTPTGISN